ncbi:hypothetical protein PybrP1_005210 [[Pythium] brassicae (nom. inval.)]|nr:hypothetical protein PybrP1_005210 [[Pythium] brassicae (nom. inval.)]
MAAKAQIAFLLNPTPLPSSRRQFHPFLRPQSPASAAVVATSRDASSPIASGTLFASPLLLLGACIAPLEKVPTLSTLALTAKAPVFPALSDASCSSDDDDDEEELESSSPKPDTEERGDAIEDEDDEEEEQEEEEDEEEEDDDEHRTAAAASRSPAGSKSGKSARKTRTPPCQVDGCKNIAVSRGCCVRHGGGSRCTVAGCANRAKLYKRCFQHGGYKTCSADGCTKKAKRYGHCWSHGGGRICEVPDCAKVSTQGGLCWAHGGGNRCKLEGCSRRSYQKYGYYCIDHAALNADKHAHV